MIAKVKGNPELRMQMKTPFILIVHGKHRLVFKTAHKNRDYLQQMGDTLLRQKDSNFLDYQIITADNVRQILTSA